MIKRWLFKIINEALENFFTSHERKMDLQFEIIRNQIEALAGKVGEAFSELNALASSRLAENEVTAHDGTSLQSQPVSTSRPSWPRMKRYLEEQDVRRVIAEQTASGDFQDAARIATKMSDEAARLEAYWKHKSARVQEEKGI